MSQKKIAVLISGRGSNLQSLINSIEEGNIKGKIDIVISNRDAYGLMRAQNYGIDTMIIGKSKYPDREIRTKILLKTLLEREIDLIVLAGYLSILDREIVDKFKNRIINIHPSLIPSFCGIGYYGERVHKAVVEYGVKITGATVHFVDEGPDTGPIILQESVGIEYDDTPETVAKKVLEIEHRLLPLAVKLYCEGRLEVEGRRVKIKG